MRLRILTLLVLAACARLTRPVPVEPDVTFAAHLEHNKMVLDRVPGRQSGVVKPASWLQVSGKPRFIVFVNDQNVAEITLTAPATVEVLRDQAAGGATGARVEPGWEDNAIRLTLRSGDTVWRSDVFQREGVGGGPPILTRTAQTILDVRGTYKAPLRDGKGGEVGWLRVKVTPYAESLRIYDAVLPAEVSPGFAAAAAVALNSEVDWIESHTLDVYRGNAGGPLRESVPLGK